MYRLKSCMTQRAHVLKGLGLQAGGFGRRAFAGAAGGKQLPSEARVVIVGGGIIGNSLAYHLVRQPGFENTVLLERDQITSGTTWHAAGLISTFGSTSATSTLMRMYTKELYKNLEAETGQSTGFSECGFIELAANNDRLEEFRRVAAFNRFCGMDVHEISPQEVQKLFPLARTDDIVAGFYVPSDGRANPVDACVALSKGARMKGAQVFEGVEVADVTQHKGKVTGVTTTSGHHIKAEYVVNCGGMWARQLAQQAGVNVPLQAAEHYYLITDPIEGVDRKWPVIEDPSSHAYIREEGGGLMVGLFEPEAAAWNVESIPSDFSFGEITPDMERMMPFVETAMGRVPASLNAGVKKFFCGPESFTADLKPVVGEAPELRNYFVAAGLNSIGILSGGGLGKELAHWIANGKAACDSTYFNINRLHTYQNNPQYRKDRTEESLGLVYKCHYPNYSTKSARGVKRSPFHERLVQQGAYFRDVSGWEGADWFAGEGVEPKVDQLTFNRESWFPQWEAEHKACREGVVAIDMSFMSKWVVEGRDAGALLNRVSTAQVDGEEGVITYTQFLNDEGKMEADVTVCKLSPTKFMVVVTDTMHRHVDQWLRKHMPEDAHVVISDATSSFAQLNIQGPKARQVMQACTSHDMSDEAFPFRSAQEIDLGYARALCVRITYVGELGYELYIPSEMGVHAYDHVMQHGRPLGLKNAGLKALSSLRLEKAYRDFGHDMDNTDSLVECGLSFTCDFNKEPVFGADEGFIGQKAVEAEKAKGVKELKQRMVQVLVKDPHPFLFHAEIVKRDGVPQGYIRAGSYGHTLGGAVGLCMLPRHSETNEAVTKKYIQSGKWEVEIAGQDYPIQLSLAPMYDPKNLQIKA